MGDGHGALRSGAGGVGGAGNSARDGGGAAMAREHCDGMRKVERRVNSMYLLAIAVGLEQLRIGGRSDNGHALAGDAAVSGGDSSRAGHQVGGGITSLDRRRRIRYRCRLCARAQAPCSRTATHIPRR